MDAFVILVIIVRKSYLFLGPVFLGWATLVVMSNFGFYWSVAFAIAVWVAIGCVRWLIKQAADLMAGKRHAAYLVLSAICWCGFAVCLYYSWLQLYEPALTARGIELAVADFLLCSSAVMLRELAYMACPALLTSH
jgi:hypothetical protein